MRVKKNQKKDRCELKDGVRLPGEFYEEPTQMDSMISPPNTQAYMLSYFNYKRMYRDKNRL